MGQEPPQGRESIPEQVRAWLAAVRAMRDNPVYALLKQTQRRRLLRTGFLRRNALMLIIGVPLVIVAVIMAVIELQPLSTWVALCRLGGSSGWLLLLTVLWDDVGDVLVPAVVMVYIAWFIQGVYEASVDALGFLNLGARRITHFVIDDTMAASPLSDREFVAAMLGVLLPPLWLRVLLGTLLLTVAMPYVVLVDPVHVLPPWVTMANVWMTMEDVGAVVLLSPVTIVCVSLAGGLGATIQLLYLITMGQGLRQEMEVVGAAAVTVAGQLAYTTLAPMAAFLIADLLVRSSLSEVRRYESLAYFSGWGALILVAVCLIAARNSNAVRAALAVATPLLAAVALPLVLFSRDAPFGASVTEWNTAVASVSYLSVWGSFFLVNPLAVPIPSCWAGSAFDWTHFPRLELLRWPVLIIIQLLLCGVLAEEARRAVAWRRSQRM